MPRAPERLFLTREIFWKFLERECLLMGSNRRHGFITFATRCGRSPAWYTFWQFTLRWPEFFGVPGNKIRELKENDQD
jgi:hypothetical protein